MPAEAAISVGRPDPNSEGAATECSRGMQSSPATCREHGVPEEGWRHDCNRGFIVFSTFLKGLSCRRVALCNDKREREQQPEPKVTKSYLEPPEVSEGGKAYSWTA